MSFTAVGVTDQVPEIRDMCAVRLLTFGTSTSGEATAQACEI